MINKFCPKCSYEWMPRTSKPKRCPRCGKWLDKIYAKQNKENSKKY